MFFLCFFHTRPSQLAVLIFLDKIVEKHTLNPEITLLNQFHAQNPMFKVPKM